MTVTDEEAMLAAISATPADDLPRLVYADWLDERGLPTRPCPRCENGAALSAQVWLANEPCRTCDGYGTVPTHAAERAEFIRVQCRTDSLPTEYPAHECGRVSPRFYEYDPAENCTTCQMMRAKVYERDLLSLHWHDWSGRFGTYCGNFHDTGAVGVTFRRGFVASVRGPLVAFWGEGECGRCTGRGDHQIYCGLCSGTGRVSGPAPAFASLAKAQPVTDVAVTDRRPLHFVNAGEWADRWFWIDAREEPDSSASLPPPLFAALTDFIDETSPGTKRYYTPDRATAALSAALVLAGRSPGHLPG